jgi:hypothetical protein
MPGISMLQSQIDTWTNEGEQHFINHNYVLAEQIYWELTNLNIHRNFKNDWFSRILACKILREDFSLIEVIDFLTDHTNKHSRKIIKNCNSDLRKTLDKIVHDALPNLRGHLSGYMKEMIGFLQNNENSRQRWSDGEVLLSHVNSAAKTLSDQMALLNEAIGDISDMPQNFQMQVTHLNEFFKDDRGDFQEIPIKMTRSLMKRNSAEIAKRRIKECQPILDKVTKYEQAGMILWSRRVSAAIVNMRSIHENDLKFIQNRKNQRKINKLRKTIDAMLASHQQGNLNIVNRDWSGYIKLADDVTMESEKTFKNVMLTSHLQIWDQQMQKANQSIDDLIRSLYKLIQRKFPRIDAKEIEDTLKEVLTISLYESWLKYDSRHREPMLNALCDFLTNKALKVGTTSGGSICSVCCNEPYLKVNHDQLTVENLTAAMKKFLNKEVSNSDFITIISDQKIEINNLSLMLSLNSCHEDSKFELPVSNPVDRTFFSPTTSRSGAAATQVAFHSIFSDSTNNSADKDSYSNPLTGPMSEPGYSPKTNSLSH